MRKEQQIPFVDHGSIFPFYSLNRNEIKWEDYLYILTPCQMKNGMWFKRDDMFAPLGYGGINGSKCRQAIWLIKEFDRLNKEKEKEKYILSGTSVHSPQLAMGSVIAMYYGYKSLHVLGSTKANTALKNDMVKIASWFKAEWDIINIGYNHNIQMRVQYLKDNYFKDSYFLHYGITLPLDNNTPEDIYNFYKNGAIQVQNISEDIENLIVPLGSANSAISILTGLFLYPKKNLKNVYLIGVGPSKIDFLFERLNIIKKYLKINCTNFIKHFGRKTMFDIIDKNSQNYNLYFYDLHSMKYVTYADKIIEHWDDIILHYTYEAKIMKFLKEKLPELLNEKSLFWIVGGQIHIDRMDYLKPILGEYPTKMNIWQEPK